jgi:hypothetical protein
MSAEEPDFVPAGVVADTRSYRFTFRPGLPITVHVVDLDVLGTDVAAWRASATKFAKRLASACGAGPAASALYETPPGLR